MTERQDHRKRITKLMLLQALTKLLQTKPIQEITVTQLCQESNINRTTFYLHYQDAYDMLDKIQQEFYDNLMEHMQNIAFDGNATGMEIPQFLVEILKYLREHADICSIVVGDNGDDSFIMRLMNIARAKSMSEYSQMYQMASAEDIEVFYTYVSYGCLGVLKNWFATNMAQPPEELASVMGRLIIQGVGFLMN